MRGSVVEKRTKRAHTGCEKFRGVLLPAARAIFQLPTGVHGPIGLSVLTETSTLLNILSRTATLGGCTHSIREISAARFWRNPTTHSFVCTGSSLTDEPRKPSVITASGVVKSGSDQTTCPPRFGSARLNSVVVNGCSFGAPITFHSPRVKRAFFPPTWFETRRS